MMKRCFISHLHKYKQIAMLLFTYSILLSFDTQLKVTLVVRLHELWPLLRPPPLKKKSQNHPC